MKILKILGVSILFVCIMLIMPKSKCMITEARAGALSIQTKKSIKMNIGKSKEEYLSVYFKGIDVSSCCIINGKSKKKRATGFYYNPFKDETFGASIKIKGKRIGNDKVKITAWFSPYKIDDVLYDDYLGEDFWLSCFVDQYLNEEDNDGYSFDLGSEEYFSWFSKSKSGYIKHPIFGWINRAQYSATYKATKTIKVKVKGYNKLKLKGNMWDYDTRTNSFFVYVKNLSNKPITIYRDRSYDEAIDKDYTSYDRKVRLEKKEVKIKPGQGKDLYYDVMGSTTWPNYKDFSLYGTLKYKGKKYAICWDSKGVHKWRRKK